jgi:hypothetical protein
VRLVERTHRDPTGASSTTAGCSTACLGTTGEEAAAHLRRAEQDPHDFHERADRMGDAEGAWRGERDRRCNLGMPLLEAGSQAEIEQLPKTARRQGGCLGGGMPQLNRALGECCSPRPRATNAQDGEGGKSLRSASGSIGLTST